MFTPEQTSTIIEFLNSHPTAVIATVNDQGNPETAVVLFAERENFELIFGTHPSRKYANIKRNAHVAFSMIRDHVAVQYEGVATELSGAAMDEYAAVYKAKLPDAAKHLQPGTIFYKVSPSWIRYMDMGQQPVVTIEAQLDAAT